MKIKNFILILSIHIYKVKGAITEPLKVQPKIFRFDNIEKNPCSTDCPSSFQPVCSSNNETYKNLCYFNIASCMDPTVKLRKFQSCTDDCIENGQIIKSGEKFRGGKCQPNCICHKGKAFCLAITCPKTSCKNPIKLPGECCGSCPIDPSNDRSKAKIKCQYNDVVYEIGSTFKKSTCVKCFCTADGSIKCFKIQCLKPNCTDPIVKPGECCPKCPSKGCTFNNMKFQMDEKYQQNSCTECICKETGIMQCKTKKCPSISCVYPIQREGECCPTCKPICQLKGKTYEVNQMVLINDCTSCMCRSEGYLDCQPTTCPKIFCKNPTKIKGLCCPVCSDGNSQESSKICKSSNITYKVNEVFDQDCMTCLCLSNGLVECHEKKCPTIYCDEKLKLPNTCCTTCSKDCVYNGKHYTVGAMWDNAECQTCTCHSGNDVRCLPKTDCPQITSNCKQKRLVKCCPMCKTSNSDLIRSLGFGCNYNGKHIPSGTFYQQTPCVLCFCDVAGKLTCTPPKSCPPLSCKNFVYDDNQCCPRCSTTCMVNKKVYTVGQTYNKDLCTKCTCQNDSSFKCESIKCRPLKCSGFYVPIGECCPKCRDGCYDSITKAFVKYGTVVERANCFFCRCDMLSRELICRKKGPSDCPRLNCPLIYQEMSNCCPVCRNICYIDGVKINAGQIYRRDGCSVCICSARGQIQCTKQQCKPVNCQNQVVPKGKCCPICPLKCVIEGKAIPIGSSLQINSCKRCICTSSRTITCETKKCPKLSCVKTKKIEGQCCPVCEITCISNTKEYQIGQYYKQSNCVKCTCKESGFDCVDAKPNCPTLTCTEKITLDNECCEKCKNTCKDTDGKVYTVGDKFKRSACTSCECKDTQTVECVDEVCQTLPCASPVSVKGKCCPQCPDICTYNSIIYKAGESFKKSVCTKCTCGAKGKLDCKDEICPALTCPTTLLVPGKCCKICQPYCEESSILYKIGQTFYRNKCTLCTCSYNGITCTNIACPAPTCSTPVTLQGECCAKCPTKCLHNGMEYNIGQEFEIKDCKTCKCNVDTTVTCAAIVCPTLTCTGKVKNKGECCEVCPNVCVKGTDNLYTVGQKYLDESTCKECVCKETGNFDCSTQYTCPTLTCPVTEAGTCCPKCSAATKFCQEITSKYHEGETFYRTECDSCKCTAGEITCTTTQCATLTCTGSYKPKGACCNVCPKAVECEATHTLNEVKTAKNGNSVTITICTRVGLQTGTINCPPTSHCIPEALSIENKYCRYCHQTHCKIKWTQSAVEFEAFLAENDYFRNKFPTIVIKYNDGTVEKELKFCEYIQCVRRNGELQLESMAPSNNCPAVKPGCTQLNTKSCCVQCDETFCSLGDSQRLEEGQMVYQDCQKCTCTGGTLSCEPAIDDVKLCGTLQCDEKIAPATGSKTDCCSKCKVEPFCIDSGKYVPKNYDILNPATCEVKKYTQCGTAPTITTHTCKPCKSTEFSYSLPNVCCPICLPQIHNCATMVNGQTEYRHATCQICYCMNGKEVCSKRKCQKQTDLTTCPEAIINDGCCNVCKSKPFTMQFTF
ncbi:hypothetical protein SNEBB_008355 [Seison nebaliae]|nr:hypothetical protein SNEBB_008355 [Seison nebaliae]